MGLSWDRQAPAWLLLRHEEEKKKKKRREEPGWSLAVPGGTA